jgi:starch phosphorylase
LIAKATSIRSAPLDQEMRSRDRPPRARVRDDAHGPQYTERFYVPSHNLWHRMVDGDLRGARELWAWKERVRKGWPAVRVAQVAQKSADNVRVGDAVRVSATVELGELSPEDVVVELYYGPTQGGLALERGQVIRMKVEEQEGSGRYRYGGDIPTRESGAHAYAVRVMPYSAAMSHPYETSLVRWD